LKDADLSSTSAKKVRQELEEKLDTNLQSRKKEIDDLVMEFVSSKDKKKKKGESEEEDEEEEEEEEEEEVSCRVAMATPLVAMPTGVVYLAGGGFRGR
jgi:upstream activation factor subunit UAF30